MHRPEITLVQWGVDAFVYSSCSPVAMVCQLTEGVCRFYKLWSAVSPQYQSKMDGGDVSDEKIGRLFASPQITASRKNIT